MRPPVLLLSLLLFSQLSLGDADTPTSPAALEKFTKYDDYRNVKVSPDGAYIAAVTGSGTLLGFMNLADRKLITCKMPEGFEITEFHWVSPTRLIYMIGEKELGYAFASNTGEIFGIDRDGTRLAYLYGYRAEYGTRATRATVTKESLATPYLVRTHKHDGTRFLVAEHPWREFIESHQIGPDPEAAPRITYVDYYSGQKTTLGRAPLARAALLVDHNDVVRFASGNDDSAKYAVSFRADANGKWTNFELPDFREDSVAPEAFAADDQSVILTGVTGKETRSGIFRLDFRNHDVKKLFAFDHSDIEDVVYDFADDQVVGALGYAESGDDIPREWLNADDPAARLYEALYRAFPKQEISITSADSGGKRVVVFVYSDTNPGDFYLFDTQAKTAQFLVHANSRIDRARMQPREHFIFKARDGLELNGFITRPAGTGPYPTVVLPHGGPYGIHDGWEYDAEAQMLASVGYAVLQLNYRGSGGYGMDFEDAGHREWGGKMQDDLTDATHWAIDQKVAAADRICIYGGSYGGYAALMGAIREPALYRCAIGEAGVYDLQLMQSTGDIRTSRSGRNYMHDKIGADSNDLHARSPAYNAEKIQIPVMLIHGSADWRADFEQATHMKAALDKNHRKYEWMELRNEGHGVFDEKTRLAVAQRIIAFLDTNLDVKR
jgi:dipeptidyl aminopeptidase/acylaminoacyl peptidase